MNNSYEEISISIVDLFKDVLKKWRILVAATLAGAILIATFGYFSSTKEKPKTEEEVKSLTAKLTLEEKTDVENGAELIMSYRTKYNSQKEYCENSIYQNLNPYEISSVVLSYYVDNNYKVSYPVISEQNKIVPMVQMYASALQDNKMYATLAKELNLDINPKYLAELVSVDFGEDDGSAIKNISGVFVVTVYADSNKLLSDVVNYIKDMLDAKTEEVSSLYGEHKLILSSEVATTLVDTDVALHQQDNLMSLISMTTNISTIEKSFTGDQLTYLKYLVHEELEEKTSVLVYVVAGALVGFVASFAFFAFKYLISKSVKTEEELGMLLKAKSFGLLSKDTSFVASKINNAIEQNNSKRLAIVTQLDSDELIELRNDIKIDSVVSIDPVKTQESYEILMSSDSVVITAVLKSTKVDDIMAIKALCDDANIDVLGSILL